MGVKVVYVPAGGIHPRGNGMFLNGQSFEFCKKRLEWDYKKWFTSKSVTKEFFIRTFGKGGHILDFPAAVVTWVDEPEENEFGPISP